MRETISFKILEAISEVKGVAIGDLSFTLHEYIDIDALETLADHESSSWTLSFELEEYNVTVTSDGLILVDGTPEKRWAQSESQIQ